MTYTLHFTITLFLYDLFVEYRICSIHVCINFFLSLFVASLYFRLSSTHPKLFPLFPLLFVASSSFFLFSRYFFSLYLLSFSHSPLLIIFYFFHQLIYYFLRFSFYFFSIIFLISPHLHSRILCSPLFIFSSYFQFCPVSLPLFFYSLLNLFGYWPLNKYYYNYDHNIPSLPSCSNYPPLHSHPSFIIITRIL